MAEMEWDAAAYRERALMAQKKAAEAPTEGLKTLWLELAERYFELADQVGRRRRVALPPQAACPPAAAGFFYKGPGHRIPARYHCPGMSCHAAASLPAQASDGAAANPSESEGP